MNRIYLYSWNPREKKIYEYEVYLKHGTAYSHPTSEEWKYNKGKIHMNEGKYWNNRVWFKKPNRERAILVFINREHQEMNDLRDKINRHNENIIFLSNYKW